jgi:TPR repeat protein
MRKERASFFYKGKAASHGVGREIGNPDSMYGLGDLYKNGGYGVDQDYGQARDWYKIAVEKGDEPVEKS